MMPIYTVQLRVNVPSVGERPVQVPLISAPSIEDAIQIAKAMVIIEAIGVQKTGDQ